MDNARSLAAALLRWDGRRLNTAAIGRYLGISRPTVLARVQELERLGLAHLLPCFGPVRRPVLHLAVFSVQGIVIDAAIGRIQEIAPDSRFSWWQATRIRKVDLVAEIGTERIGFCFLHSAGPRNRHVLPLKRALQREVINRGFLLHTEDRAFVRGGSINCLPVWAFLSDPQTWLLCRADAPAARARINQASALAWQKLMQPAHKRFSQHVPARVEKRHPA